MKKVSIILFLLILGVAFDGFSQAPAPSDFFVGKWKATFPVAPEVAPVGETNFWIDIVRKEGKLTIHLGHEKIINSRVQDEHATELFILFDMANNVGFSSQLITAKDATMVLTKVDDDTLQVGLQGSSMTAKRVK